MKALARQSILTAIAANTAFALAIAGCSGPGAPAIPPELEALQATANDHLTTVLHVKRWFTILYPSSASTCTPGFRPLPKEPDDPPGSVRVRITLSDCTEVTVFQLADGSGSQSVLFPDGREKEVAWSPATRDPDWVKQMVHEELWDDAELTYEVGLNLTSPRYDRYETGTARLPDGREMGFSHHRNLDRDSVDISPDDGSALHVEVPLTSTASRVYWPVLAEGATGTFDGGTGGRLAFTVRGTESDGWLHWEVSGEDGTEGRFALAADFAGSGELTKGGRMVAAFRWSPTGEGRLQPTSAAAVDVVPSAAARSFEIDAWIRNIAAMGPSPMY